MLHFDRIDMRKGVDVAKSNNNVSCEIVNHGFKFQYSICYGVHDLTMLYFSSSNIVIITVKGADYCCIIHDVSKPESIHLLENCGNI